MSADRIGWTSDDAFSMAHWAFSSYFGLVKPAGDGSIDGDPEPEGAPSNDEEPPSLSEQQVPASLPSPGVPVTDPAGV